MKSISEYLPTTYWLMKTEPSVFSFEDLMKRPHGERWDGVRSFQARNFMRDHMQVGHKILIYHSNAQPSGVAGLAEVIRDAEPDLTALDPHSPGFDPKATWENPIWCAVTVGNPRPFQSFVSLPQLRNCEEISDMLLLRKGQRLSILPLAQDEFLKILQLGGLSL